MGRMGTPRPRSTLSARSWGKIGAQDVPEIVVVNKADAADPRVLDRLRRVERCPLVVSARTGEGLPELAAAIEAALPRPAREVRALVPYARGDLVARAYRTGEVLSEEHVANGTLLHARVEPELAADLGEYAAKAAT